MDAGKNQLVRNILLCMNKVGQDQYELFASVCKNNEVFKSPNFQLKVLTYLSLDSVFRNECLFSEAS